MTAVYFFGDPQHSIYEQVLRAYEHRDKREVMDEVFGAENFVAQIAFETTSGFDTATLATLGDFLLWYAKDKGSVGV